MNRSLSDTPQETARDRFRNYLTTSGLGTAAAVTAVPLVMTRWAPPWFAVGWAVVYLILAVLFICLLSLRPSERWRLSWAVAAAIQFMAINGSVLIWGTDLPEAAWIATTISLGYLAFEVATLPYLKVERWYAGPAIVAASVMVLTFVELGWAEGISFTLLLGAMIVAGMRNRDAREALDTRLDEVRFMAERDHLTGLLNRRGFAAALSEIPLRATVAIFDADRFKLINDTHGYAVGDAVLVSVARHLEQALPADWTLARLGGDEFVAVAQGNHHLPAPITGKLPLTVSREAGSLSVSVSVSAGVATGDISNGSDRLLSEAGYALRQAKDKGAIAVRSKGALRERFERSLAVSGSAGLRKSIQPFAQPIFHGDGSLAGCELLARWELPDGQLLPPVDFLHAIVEHGLMRQLDEVMIERAIRRLNERDDLGGSDRYVSVNVTPSNVLDEDFLRTVRSMLASTEIAPHRLMFEITESEMRGDQGRWEEAVWRLRDLGVLLAIDDFGAGYSSIERLQRLPITHLKLDRSFLEGGAALDEIARGVVRYCKASGIGVIAEGIESAADLARMRMIEVGWFQGYHLGRPAPLSELVVRRWGADVDRDPERSPEQEPLQVVAD